MTEPKPDLERVWRRFALTFLGVFGGALGFLYLALLVVDPYDTGRFPTFMKPGVVDEGQRTSNASHGRDPRFTAAVIGNSRGQMLDPAKLSAATGMNFVQLTTPASGPVEQMTMLRYFMQYHRRIDAVILTIDERWCGHDRSLPIILPFPFWLYRGDLEYLSHFFSTRALTFAARRIKMELGLVPADDARGYQDYETGHYRNFHPGPLRPVETREVAPLGTPFAGFDLLDPVLAELPATTRVVFLMSPVYQVWLDELDPQMIADLPRCKTEVAARAAARPNTTLLDYFHESPISHDAENFMDTQHFRLNIARLLEARIVEALNVQDSVDPARGNISFSANGGG
ncbi:MAG: hypothetical protein JO228_14475 [Xanthobacteraceae bacterium]|nr:hypothetical protein [Xanthobacteraceae bacterium]